MRCNLHFKSQEILSSELFLAVKLLTCIRISGRILTVLIGFVVSVSPSKQIIRCRCILNYAIPVSFHKIFNLSFTIFSICDLIY